MSFRGFKSPEHFAYECINGADTGKDPEFTLNGLGLSYLPSNIGWLAHLTLLDLSNNHLSTLPIELRYLTKLEELHLGNNAFLEIPEVLRYLPKLKTLTLDGNKIKHLTPSIRHLFQLQNLTYLDLSRNGIEELVPEIGDLTTLNYLSLAENNLRALPPVIGNLSNLTQVNVSKNALAALPKELGKLERLAVLRADHNKLIDLPVALRDLRYLAVLLLHSNPVLQIPVEALGPEYDEIIAGAAPADPWEILYDYFEEKEEREARRPPIFISYMRDDIIKVGKLCEALEEAGLAYWLDRSNLQPGEDWRAAIRRAIQEGAFFLACFSRASTNHDRSYIHEELNQAIEELRLRPQDSTWFIPVILSGEVPDLRIDSTRTLRSIQWVDLGPGKWEEGLATLIRMLKSEVD